MTDRELAPDDLEDEDDFDLEYDEEDCCGDCDGSCYCEFCDCSDEDEDEEDETT